MPKALRTLRLSFRETHLTHFGGMVLLQRFCNKLGLRRLLQQWIRIPQRNADYHPSDLILALLYAIMAGLRRINKTDILQYNGTFLSLLGLPRFPDQSTLRRFLKRVPPKVIRQLVALHDHLRTKLFPPGALVQEVLLAQGVSLRHAGYHSYGLPGLAGQTHQPRGPERLGAAPRPSLSGTVPSRTEEDRKTPASMNSLNLQVTPPRPFSIFKGSASKNRNFTHY